MSVVILSDGRLFDDHKQLMISCPKTPTTYCCVDCALCALDTDKPEDNRLVFLCGCRPGFRLLSEPYKPPVDLQREQGIIPDDQKGADNEVPEG